MSRAMLEEGRNKTLVHISRVALLCIDSLSLSGSKNSLSCMNVCSNPNNKKVTVVVFGGLKYLKNEAFHTVDSNVLSLFLDCQRDN